VLAARQGEPGSVKGKKKNIAVHVTRSAETAQRKWHPWLFESDIKKLSHEGEAGDIAVVFDNNNQYLSIGLFDPFSPIRGENDGLGGLVVDRYGNTLVLKIYTSAWLAWLDTLRESLVTVTMAERVVLLISRQMQKLPTSVLKGWTHGSILHGQPLPDGGLTFVECG
jgi:23S rRNA (cytosine1962-C5)-methyltransferase